jgi:hypothetical protein
MYWADQDRSDLTASTLTPALHLSQFTFPILEALSRTCGERTIDA